MPRTKASRCIDERSAGGCKLGSVTLTWYQVLVIVAAVIGFYAVELAAFLRVARRQAEHEAGMRGRVDELAAELAALRERVTGLGADIDAVRRAPQSSGQYREAVEMAEQGLDAAEVADNCGISRAEADLIVALHRSRTA
jgi:hypothetical protein